jgi:tetratricopeptide (TPR) repeat protein
VALKLLAGTLAGQESFAARFLREALTAHEQVISGYWSDSNPALRKLVAKALIKKGVVLGTLGRSEEELAAYQQVITDYRDDSDPALREQVAQALYNKSIVLGELGRFEEELAAYGQLIAEYRDDTTPGAHEAVGRALTVVSRSCGESEDGEWSGHVAAGPSGGLGDVGASG